MNHPVHGKEEESDENEDVSEQEPEESDAENEIVVESEEEYNSDDSDDETKDVSAPTNVEPEILVSKDGTKWFDGTVYQARTLDRNILC